MIYSINDQGDCMLINIDTLEEIKSVAHEKEFSAWRTKLTPTEFNAIVDYMNTAIDSILDNNEKIINVTALASPSWENTPYDLIYSKACDGYEDLSALFFGSIAWYVIMHRNERWACGKYNFVKNRDIQGMTYFLVK